MNNRMFLQKLNTLNHEIEQLKRELLLSDKNHIIEPCPSLYGSVQGGDITEEMIDGAQKSLFRNLKDL
ncbi:hypothetical protein IH992_20745 [Candidatus Poribacteria bacterium]|nr:hypothetical protein [Candidatus Poribacteria bacterium]